MAVAIAVAYLLYPHPTQELAEKNVKEIVFWCPINPVTFDPLRPLIEEFEHRNPGYRVRMGTATARDDTGDPTRFLLGVAGGVPPDLIYFDRFAVVEWASRGAFTDLTPLIERDKEQPDAIRKENFYEVAWNEPVYKGKNYAIANAIDTRAMFYLEDPLVRAGFTYGPNDPEVLSGEAKAGAARPPKTWEEMCLKRGHYAARVQADGTVEIQGFLRRPAVNTEVPADAKPDLRAAGVRAGDVVALVAGTNVFRGRVRSVDGPATFHIDFQREQPPGLNAVPEAFRTECEVKLYDQDCYMARLTRFDPQTGQLSVAAFIPISQLFGNSWLYLFSWLNGGEFMSADGTTCTLDSPEVVEALQWVSDAYDCLGGYNAAKVFEAGAGNSGINPMFIGKVAMLISSDQMIGQVLAFKPDLRFGAVGSPLPKKRLEAGAKPLGWAGGWSYAIPSTARDKEGAWLLMKWLCSPEANRIFYESQATLCRAKGQPFFPMLHPDRRVMEWIQKQYIQDPSLPPWVPKAFECFEKLLPNSRYRPVTPVGQKLWSEHVRAIETGLTHAAPPYESLNYGARRVQAALDHLLHPPTGPTVNWPLLVGGYAAAVALIFVGLLLRQRYLRRRGRGWHSGWYEGYIAAAPWLLGFIVFTAGPMLFSLIISFCAYDVLNPARFIGIDNYVSLFGRHFDSVTNTIVWNDPILWKSLGNTLYMALGVPLSIVLGLTIAMLLDTRVRGLHIYRTVYYLPAIVPIVATFILWIWIFEPTRGMLNQVLHNIGIVSTPNWLQDPAWSKPALILMSLWGVGSSMIIWLAGLKDIPETFYEAASIDGANRFHRFIHITLPLLSPYIFFNMIMGFIAVFQVFEVAYIMTDGGPADSTYFYVYKLFHEAFRLLNMGIASAMAWFLFLIVLGLTLFQLWLGKKWVHYGG